MLGTTKCAQNFEIGLVYLNTKVPALLWDLWAFIDLHRMSDLLNPLGGTSE